MLSKLNINIGDMIIIQPNTGIYIDEHEYEHAVIFSNRSIGIIKNIIIKDVSIFFSVRINIKWVAAPLCKDIHHNEYLVNLADSAYLCFSFSYLFQLLKDKKIEVIKCCQN